MANYRLWAQNALKKDSFAEPPPSSPTSTPPTSERGGGALWCGHICWRMILKRSSKSKDKQKKFWKYKWIKNYYKIYHKNDFLLKTIMKHDNNETLIKFGLIIFTPLLGSIFMQCSLNKQHSHTQSLPIFLNIMCCKDNYMASILSSYKRKLKERKQVWNVQVGNVIIPSHE